MAYSLFYSINRGQVQNPQAVLVATSSQAEDVQLEIDLTNKPTKLDVILALRAFEQFILTNGVGTTTGNGVDLPLNIAGNTANV